MSSTKDSDSREIAILRDSYRRQSKERATPLRLGAYAAARKLTVTDYGAHSAHWIGLFEEGFRYA